MRSLSGKMSSNFHGIRILPQFLWHSSFCMLIQFFLHEDAFLRTYVIFNPKIQSLCRQCAEKCLSGIACLKNWTFLHQKLRNFLHLWSTRTNICHFITSTGQGWYLVYARRASCRKYGREKFQKRSLRKRETWLWAFQYVWARECARTFMLLSVKRKCVKSV